MYKLRAIYSNSPQAFISSHLVAPGSLLPCYWPTQPVDILPFPRLVGRYKMVAVGWPLCRLVALRVALWVCYSLLPWVARFVPIAVGWSLWAGRSVGRLLCRLVDLYVAFWSGYGSVALCRSLCGGCFVSVAVG